MEKKWKKLYGHLQANEILSEKAKPPKCPDCGVLMKQEYNKKTRKIYYSCPNKCDIFITAHPDGTPVGYPVRREVRELRTLAHKLADRIWEYKDFAQRQKMYIWLKKNSLPGHFGKMNEEELVNIIDKLQKIIKRFNK